MNEDHLHGLLYETETWNEWRRKHPKVRPDLSHAELNRLASKATLERNDSIFERFQERNFRGIDLHEADLRGAKIWLSDLGGVNLGNADLSGAEIRRSHLRGADLRGADLRNTQFVTTDLSGARFDGAIFGKTHLGYTKLVDAQGADQVQHTDASYIDHFSIINSMPLPTAFLNACGVPAHTIRMAEWHAHDHPYHTCFISYSRRDEPFVGYLREALTWAGVPSWFAPQDMRPEEFQSEERELQRDLHNYIDEAERVLLVLSPNILPSGWVGKEVQRARNHKPVIPILIENMPTSGSPEWNALIAESVDTKEYRLLDSDSYSKELTQLLSGSFLEFRNWRNPALLTDSFYSLLFHLRRTT
jgi:hypothetical protein